MSRSWMAAIVAALSLAVGAAARAQSAPTRYVFVTVDAVAAETNRLRVTGVVEGEATAREILFSFYFASDYGAMATYIQACERKALLAMTKPGQYLFEVSAATTYSSPTCKLTRLNP